MNPTASRTLYGLLAYIQQRIRIAVLALEGISGYRAVDLLYDFLLSL